MAFSTPVPAKVDWYVHVQSISEAAASTSPLRLTGGTGLTQREEAVMVLDDLLIHIDDPVNDRGPRVFPLTGSADHNDVLLTTVKLLLL